MTDGLMPEEGRSVLAADVLRDQFGSALAAKVTPDCAVALTSFSDVFGGGPGWMKVMREAALPVVRPRPVIVEVDGGGGARREELLAIGGELAESAQWEAVRDAVAEAGQRVPDLGLRADALIRHARVDAVRRHFYESAGAIADELERTAGTILGGSPLSETMGTVPSPTTQMCWLNGTIRTVPDPAALAVIAEDERVRSIDVGRRLHREVNMTGSTIGAPAYRDEESVDGTNIIIAVLDGEVAAAHPDFGGRVSHRLNHTLEPWGNPDGHGTAVASIAAGSHGVAPGATILNYKVLATVQALNADDFGGSVALQRAVEDGAHIANCSWGVSAAGTTLSREADACDTAWLLGMVVIKSAGNRGPTLQTLTSPAEAEGVIVVGATDRLGTAVQDYSSRGPLPSGGKRPHLVAPGGSPDDQITAALPGGAYGPVGYGTSYAAPHVAGAAALLLQANGSLTPDAVRSALIRMSTPLAGADPDSQGAGLLELA